MKAYMTQLTYENSSNVVFAKDTAEAKKKAYHRDFFFHDTWWGEDFEYIDIRVWRLPLIDNCEDKPPIEVAEKLILQGYWVWTFNDGEIISEEDNFDRKKFEEEWQKQEELEERIQREVNG